MWLTRWVEVGVVLTVRVHDRLRVDDTDGVVDSVNVRDHCGVVVWVAEGEREGLRLRVRVGEGEGGEGVGVRRAVGEGEGEWEEEVVALGVLVHVMLKEAE